MRFLLILGFVAFTSVGGLLYGSEILRLPRRDLSAAWRTTLESIWIGLVFFALNLLVAFAAILSFRVAPGRFTPLYDASDVTLLVLSFLQGTVFHLWRRAPGDGP